MRKQKMFRPHGANITGHDVVVRQTLRTVYKQREKRVDAAAEERNVKHPE